MGRRAMVLGSGGQDGRILVQTLAPDHAVVGVDLDGVTTHGLPLESASPLPAKLELTDAEAMRALIESTTPDEIYYLAAHHHSSEERPDDASELRACLNVHVVGLVNVLDAMAKRAPACRLFYAGSSHMFGQPHRAPQSESTPFAPKNPYAITKVAAAHTIALYRARGLHASVGILYNHESPLRGPQFVTSRIVQGAHRAKADASYRLTLGSLAAVVDWGWAADYVDAMLRIVRARTPDDYVIATGEPHTVQDFATIAFAELGLDARAHVTEDPTRVQGVSATLVGDATRLRTQTGWKPTMSFDEMVRTLVRAHRAEAPR